MPPVAGYITVSSPCGPVTISQSVPPLFMVCAGTGPFSVLITVSDTCGNTTNCTVPFVFDRCCVEPPANMVLWLTFDEAVGSVAYNSRGGNDGTLYDGGVVGTASTGPAHDSFGGYVSRSLIFDGVNDAVRVPSYPAINVGSADFSVDAWIRPSADNVNGVIVQKIEYAGVQRGWSLELHGNYLFLQLTVPGFGQTLCSGICPGVYVTPLQWHHVALTMCRGDTNGGRFYLDGQVVATFNPTPWAGSLSTSVPLAVGGPSLITTGDPYFYGHIDEVELFCRCLSSDEVRSLWQARDKGKCKLDCTLVWDKSFWFQDTTVQVQAYINNPSPIAQTMNYSLSWLPIDGANCKASGVGSFGFSPASGTVTVGAGTTLCLPITIAKPTTLDPGECACYQIVIQPQNSNARFVCQGSVCASTSTNICVTVVGPGNVTNNVFTWDTDFAGTLTWTLTNAGPVAHTADWMAIAYGPDMLPATAITLIPAFGTVNVASQGVVHLPVSYYFGGCDFFHFHHIVLHLDTLPVDGVVLGWKPLAFLTPHEDVTQPGDPIVPTSPNSPGSEGVANAIDNQRNKYLNFDEFNTGFTVTPRVGRSIVQGLTLTSANDAPERDPASFVLEGSDDGTNFTLIASKGVPAFPDRFFTHNFTFANGTPYLTYRLIFPTVADEATANSMQISEVELLGFLAAAPQLNITPMGGQLCFSWSGQAVFETTSSLTPPINWAPAADQSNPQCIVPTGTQKFFRLRRN
jgi:hypothetical protein